VHEVKIDRSFVIGLRDKTDDAAIVRAIVRLGAIWDFRWSPKA
jgi:EAL domain-containing protein (putative c-di-GMP-specific phosphodiesterase class I)